MSGSITAQINFVSYKIDAINLKMNNKLSNLLNTDPVKPENIKLGISLRSTEKFNVEGKIIYVGGLSTKIAVIDPKDHEEMLQGLFGISGLFELSGSIETKFEETFTQENIPAILMPHLRATMTNALSNAGFGTVLFPLVNMVELAKKQKCPLIDRTQESTPLPEQIL